MEKLAMRNYIESALKPDKSQICLKPLSKVLVQCATPVDLEFIMKVPCAAHNMLTACKRYNSVFFIKVGIGDLIPMQSMPTGSVQ